MQPMLRGRSERWRSQQLTRCSDVWPFFSLAGLAYPWYLLWGLPYALRSRAASVEFLALLPLAAALLETDFPSGHPRQYAMTAMLLYLVSELVRYRKRAISLAR